MTAAAIATWSVPRLWPGERCFIICGGASVKDQRALVPRLEGRVIAVKQGIVLRPDADVFFVNGERNNLDQATSLVRYARAEHHVVRGRHVQDLPASFKRLNRHKDHTRLCDDPTRVSGYDTGTSAINLAYLLGATEIVLLGYDMTGGHWFNGELKHPLPFPPEDQFTGHMAPLPALAEDCRAKGLRVVNVSPISRVACFERGRLEDFL